MRRLGWRLDCLGDLGFWKGRVADWAHMFDVYPQQIIESLVLRKLTLPSRVQPNGVLPFKTWWENKGVAPCYEDFALALRLVGETRTVVRLTDARIPSWLPGDALCDGRVFLPRDLDTP